MFRTAFTGIDFKDNKVNIATVRWKRGKPELRHLLEAASRTSWFEGGRVRDIAEMPSLIKKQLIHKGMLAKPAHLCYPTQHVILRHMDSLPDLPEEELAKVIAFELGESIHLPFQNPIYDFKKLGTMQPTLEPKEDVLQLIADESDEDGAQIEPKSHVLFMASSKDLGEDLYQVSQRLFFKPKTAEIKALSLQRLVSYLHPQWLQETEVMIDLGDETTDIHIYQDGVVQFTRSVSVDRASFRQPIEENDMINLEVAATEDVLPAPVELEMHVDKDWEWGRYLDQILSELERAQNFFRYTLKQRANDVIRLIIMGSYHEEMVTYLKERLAYDVDEIDFEGLLKSRTANLLLLNPCSVAIGLALRGKD